MTPGDARCRAAQPAVAADRFAREIVHILAVCAALAAAERQPVGQRTITPLLLHHPSCATLSTHITDEWT
jgi:hypothetical protein